MKITNMIFTVSSRAQLEKVIYFVMAASAREFLERKIAMKIEFQFDDETMSKHFGMTSNHWWRSNKIVNIIF